MAEATGRGGYQELRLALVFNGGVSLAVWMGGVAKEIDRVRSAFYRGDAAVDPYRDLLDAVETELITDVIAGTSAGGINGALLGYVVANGRALETPGQGASSDAIRATWEKLGAIDELLDQEGKSASALNGNFLFQGCADVFDILGRNPALDNDPPTRMRLTVTATDSAGYPVEVAGVTGRDHRLEMRFRAVTYPQGDAIRLSSDLKDAIARVAKEDRRPQWPFPPPPSARDLCADDAAALLARAARTTASFPIAFAASTLPLATARDAIRGDTTGLTATPSMREVITTRGAPDVLADTASRYAVDGGIWDNAPFEAVLRSIDRTPASREVDRRLVYVIYTAEDASGHERSVAGGPDRPPELIGSVAHTLTTPSNVAFANDLERIARDAARQRGRQRMFTWLLRDGKPDVFELAEQLLPVYVEDSAEVVRVAATLSAGGRPLADRSLEEWGATPADWAWDIRPVQVAIENGRRLLREVLRQLAAGATEHLAARLSLIEARDVLSQLAWALSDLADRHSSQPALTSDERAVCGFAMAQFAETMSRLHDSVLAGLTVPATPDGDTSAIAISFTVTDGGAEMIVKRAIATEIAVHALGADARPHKVDYTFETIRPATSWPLTAGQAEPDERPPLEGTNYKHFGGFLLTSWRMSDWMWGRLDASTRIVDMLLDGSQFQRLTAGREPSRAELAAKLAELAIPTRGVDPTRTRHLAYCAFAGHGLKDEPGAPGDPQKEHGAPSDGQVEGWRGRLAQTYADIIANTPAAGGASAELKSLRADVRRRLQYAILDDERPELIKQINEERADSHLRVDDGAHAAPLDEESLSAELDGGLRTLAAAIASTAPNHRPHQLRRTSRQQHPGGPRPPGLRPIRPRRRSGSQRRRGARARQGRDHSLHRPHPAPSLSPGRHRVLVDSRRTWHH